MESCQSACNKNGLICSEKEFSLHKAEVDSSDKVLNLIEKLGGTTSATSCVSGDYPALPVFNHDTYCMISAKGTKSTFDCTTEPGPQVQLKRRICYCHTLTGMWAINLTIIDSH